ncbi:TATA binding associated factor 4 [Tubulinosema ratisbonensis]|uniref:Transcription initiation factor TFIID subunit 4 n=1 Tax=Tubulinosema ratisbonensis TaxID=291195 RepID=A0A437AQ25_9MICR|nr:TATA binding associated factor 4 [Tubulinosema ratisbonensis]
MINNEFLESLQPNKKNKIKTALESLSNKTLTSASFLEICRMTLDENEYQMLFHTNRTYQQKSTQPDEIKTEFLHDIMHYSGIDLKQETENLREAEEYTSFGYDLMQERDNEISSFFNMTVLIDSCNKICKNKKLTVDNEVYYLLFLGIKRKLLDLFDKMVSACKMRVEEELQSYVIRIDNDIRRQLWVLEQEEKKEFEKLKIERFENDERKRLKRAIEEREDLVIKKRMSNTIALQALGRQQKSWMDAPDSDVNIDKDTQFQSLYSPFNEKDLEKRIVNKQITMEDYLFVMERDKRYSKSIATIQHYYK